MWNGNDEIKLTLKTIKKIKYVVTNLTNKYHITIKNKT